MVSKEYKAKWQREFSARRRAEIRLILLTTKAQPCKDCGEDFPHYCMDFDHCRGRKLITPSHMQAKWIHKSDAEIRKELKKCDVVCANCHRKRTFKRNPTKFMLGEE